MNSMLRDADGWSLLSRLLRWSVTGLAAGHAMLFAYTTIRRVGYPFSLEWMESGSYDSLARLLEGSPLYDRPSTGFVAFNYTPLYYLASAAVAHVMGLGFAPMRLLSLLAAYGTMVVVYRLVRGSGGGRFPALAGAVTFAATFPLTDGFADTARPDSLYVLLLTAGVAALVHGGSARWSPVLAGVLFGAAYFTKQAAVPSLGLLFLYLLVRQPSVGLRVLPAFALTVGAGVAWFSWSTDGWFGYYTLEIATGHDFRLRNLLHFPANYLGPLAVAVLFGATWLAWPARERTRSDETLLVALVSILFGCFWLTLYPGIAPNVAIPAAMACSVLLGLGADSVLELVRGREPRFAARLTALMFTAVALQWGGLLYTPSRYVPDARDEAAGRALVAEIARSPGEVLIPNHGYLARLAGKPGQAHAMALVNASANERGGHARRVAQEFDSAVANGCHTLLVLDADNVSARDPIPGYGPPVECFSDPRAFHTRTGTRTRPEYFRYRLDPSTPR